MEKTEQKKKTTEKTIADNVLTRVNQFRQLGQITLPKDYDPGNALKSAWLLLLETKDKEEKPVLEVCSKESIANALFEMVITGLSPMKKQCSFIAYGKKLICQREYPGTIALAKRFGGVRDITSNVIYQGDEFIYQIDPTTGRKTVEKHIQNFGNINDTKILGAYATLILENGSTEMEVMNYEQIKKSWMQGANKGNSPAHRNFPGEMCRKSVIYRACKTRINSSDDSPLGLLESEIDPNLKQSEEEIRENANTEDINFEEITDTPTNGHPEKPEKKDPEPTKEKKEPENKQQKIGPGF